VETQDTTIVKAILSKKSNAVGITIPFDLFIALLKNIHEIIK
jgi:hypothetical protein